jgi:hypothetical protein
METIAIPNNVIEVLLLKSVSKIFSVFGLENAAINYKFAQTNKSAIAKRNIS